LYHAWCVLSVMVIEAGDRVLPVYDAELVRHVKARR